MSEWISVKETYPNHHQKVIFYVKDRGECFCGFFEVCPEHRRISSNTKNVFYENLNGWWFEDEEITHWMPLPNPPEGKK